MTASRLLAVLATALCITVPAHAQAVKTSPDAVAAPGATPGPLAPSPAAAPTAPGPAPTAPGPAPGISKAAPPMMVATTPARDIGQLAWMHGCWSGTVNQRTFTEHWTAPAAGVMLGLGHTVIGDKSESFEFMRLETRPDGRIAYILRPSARDEEPFVFEGVGSGPDVEFFVFANPRAEFPARIIYSHASGGRMYVHVQGKVNGADREVVYPFVPVDCGSGKAL